MIFVTEYTTDADEALSTITLRQEDQDELKATWPHMSANEALINCIEFSSWTHIVYNTDFEILFVYGLTLVGPDKGIPWMLGTDLTLKHKRECLRLGKQIVELMLKHCPVLSNCVHVENKTHIRWLKWMGFTFTGKEIINLYGHKFLHFQKIRGG